MKSVNVTNLSVPHYETCQPVNSNPINVDSEIDADDNELYETMEIHQQKQEQNAKSNHNEDIYVKPINRYSTRSAPSI